MKAEDLNKEVNITGIPILENGHFTKYMSDRTIKIRELLEMISELSDMEQDLNETRDAIMEVINKNIS